MTALRSLRRIVALVGALALCLPAHLLIPGRKGRWVRRFLALATRACGVRPQVVGDPVREHVLYAANHISWLDIVVLGGATGATFVSKKEVRDWPVIGYLAKVSGTIFISRESRGETRGQADTIATALAGGRPVALFPEGTTGGGTDLLPFRASLFASVAGRELTVQPVAIDYGLAAPELTWPRTEPAHVNALKLLRRKGTLPVTIRFAEPIPTAALDRKEIARRAEAAVDAGLHEGYSARP